MSYTLPTSKAKAFSCPHCNVYARQIWCAVYYQLNTLHVEQNLDYVLCDHCRRFSLWSGERMIYPDSSNTPLPNPDLREDIKEDYLEASSIVSKSPRGAVAILRLCIQKMCEQLGEKGKNINEDIASLVAKGLSIQIQRALDIVRVVGNNAVHPGQIDLQDNTDIANQLFVLINLIADITISQPKHIESLYNSLPSGAIEAIEKRDSKNK